MCDIKMDKIAKEEIHFYKFVFRKVSENVPNEFRPICQSDGPHYCLGKEFKAESPYYGIFGYLDIDNFGSAGSYAWSCDYQLHCTVLKGSKYGIDKNTIMAERIRINYIVRGSHAGMGGSEEIIQKIMPAEEIRFNYSSALKFVDKSKDTKTTEKTVNELSQV